jgi:hypothetical protein
VHPNGLLQCFEHKDGKLVLEVSPSMGHFAFQWAHSVDSNPIASHDKLQHFCVFPKHIGCRASGTQHLVQASVCVFVVVLLLTPHVFAVPSLPH